MIRFLLSIGVYASCSLEYAGGSATVCAVAPTAWSTGMATVCAAGMATVCTVCTVGTTTFCAVGTETICGVAAAGTKKEDTLQLKQIYVAKLG